ncbi:hypothetical protein CYLTODRAFT_460499 [Cylindrobasidium torrendii FP15055 ss-10]|uniref:Ribonuclease H1 N-terminal domain-containing protein n=1 Tax=Cylindrobasidium torrendii FP15055 ss-10 TaxID=1314674 RepID=A0A0D7ASB4_9AGAR|nr:hypothetical protein CYLTODRAFT_460499 [Cylindrobasidium torrendii FP15055 ss-10]
MSVYLTPPGTSCDIDETASAATDLTEAEIERSFVFLTPPPSENTAHLGRARWPLYWYKRGTTKVTDSRRSSADIEALVQAVAAMRIPDRNRCWYAIRNKGGTEYTDSWSVAGRAAVCDSALVQCLTSRRLVPSGHTTAYVVFIGHETGVVRTWRKCQNLVSGVPYNIYQGYQTYELAVKAYNHALANRFVHKSGQLPADWRLNVREPGPLFVGVASKKFYVVFRGICPGVYTTYLEAMISVLGVNGNVFRSYDNEV